jgi:hypothetical protein
MKRRGQLIGYVRSLEITWGKANGWHPHIHVVMFVSKSTVLSTLIEQTEKRWIEVVGQNGGHANPEHAVKCWVHNKYNALYPLKWGIAEETMRGGQKEGKRGRYTPFQMLQKYLEKGSPGPAYWGKLMKEYQEAIKGSKQAVWSRKPSLRSLLPEPEEKTEQDIVSGTEAGYMLLATLTRDQWDAIVTLGMRGTVLDCCARGDVQMAMDIIEDSMASHLRGIDRCETFP